MSRRHEPWIVLIIAIGLSALAVLSHVLGIF